MNKPLVLIACCKTKLHAPAPAKQMYRSDLFSTARMRTEDARLPWRVLSARYGLVHPEQEIEPYNQTLNTMTQQERDTWAASVMSQIVIEQLPIVGRSIIFLAGKRYRERLGELLNLAGARVHYPLLGLGLGQQLKSLKHDSVLEQWRA